MLIIIIYFLLSCLNALMCQGVRCDLHAALPVVIDVADFVMDECIA